MSGALESSVTLDDVFVVVGAKRVPLAPELAGYLALEIAEEAAGAGDGAGDVDPQRVYIGEEGSVALVVRPRRDARDPATGDAEMSIRVLLGRLLDASGAQTPALGGVARRHGSSGGLAGLVEELEAALIPVNRAAGRRALARLAREVKRVTLGVGRNASLAPGEPSPRRQSSPAHGAVRDPPGPRAPEPPKSARSVAQEGPHARPRNEESAPTAPRDSPRRVLAPSATPPLPDASELPTIEVRKEQLAAVAPRANAAPTAPNDPRAEARAPQVDEVDNLLASFGVSHGGEEAARKELKALVGLDPTPPPPGSQHLYEDDEAEPPAPEAAPRESDVESLLNLSDAPPVARVSPPTHPLASPPTAISPRLANEPYVERGSARMRNRAPSASHPSRPSQSEAGGMVPTAPSARKLADLSSFHTPRAPQTGRVLSVGALVLLGAGAAAVYVLKPSFITGHGDVSTPAPQVASASTSSAGATAPQTPRCRASIVVNDAPDGSEVLLRVGQAPVDVDHMPVGARLEFVAMAEGFAPKRVVIPAGATWDSGGDGKPRYEAAVQLDRSRARAGAVDNWPPAEPGSEVGGKGPPGTVHLVATPRGAEIWLLTGLGPSARIDQLKCGGDVDLLIAGPTTHRKRLHVSETSFLPVDGGPDREATISAK